MSNEHLLIQELQKGSRQAFTHLVETYQHMVYNTVLSFVQHAEDAEDVAQEVFIQAFEQISRFRGESKLSTWLYRIAVNKSIDAERKKKTKKRINLVKKWVGLESDEVVHLSDFHHPGVSLDRKEDAMLLFKALNQLSEKQKTVFLLIKAEGLSYEEISHIMNITVKAVESLMYRAKDNLKNILANVYQINN